MRRRSTVADEKSEHEDERIITSRKLHDVEATAKKAAECAVEAAAEAIAETSAKLAGELDTNARPTGHVTFDSANRAKESPLDPDFERIVETIFVEQPLEMYTKLEKALRVGDGRADHGSVNKSLDEAESNARLAFRLSITAKLERDRWERENDVVFAGMRAEATSVLQREKDQKLRSKQITDADVESACAALFPDEWRHQEHKRRKVELMVKNMENLAEMWASRCRSLQAMLAKQR